VAGAVGLRHQDADVLADRLLLGPAEQAFGGGAEQLHDAATVDDDHGVGNGVKDRAEVGLTRAQRFLDLPFLVDIEEDAAEMASDAGFVSNQAGAGPDPFAAAGVAGNPEGDVEAAAMLGDLLDRVLDARAVAGLETRQEEVVARRLAPLDTEQHPRGFRPLQLARHEVEIPSADAESLDPDPEMLAATVVWRMRYAGRRQSMTPIFARRAWCREHDRNFAHGPARGKFGCLIPLADFPQGRVRRFDLPHPAPSRRG
jgi:hypothetical protein